MSFKVGVLDPDQRVSDLPCRKVKRKLADRLVSKGVARRISKSLIQIIGEQVAIHQLICAYDDGPLGRGNLIPFSKSQNPYLAPQKLHYEIPRAGDLGMRRHGLFARTNDEGKRELHSHTIQVSGRNLFSRQLLPAC
jgi:hypothetical protein